MSTLEVTNDERERARQIIEFTGTHLFLTGKAGTGKTTFLRQLKQDCPKRMIVLAPTGIAAINAGGSTIHSFFQLPFSPFIPNDKYKKMDFKLRKQKIKLIRSLDLIVIDEISMVRADLLDQIDAVLRQYRTKHEPFGGVQLLMIGDLQQLAPVAKEEEWNLLSQYYESPYFFSSLALKQSQYVTIELQKVYRQSDPTFLHLLNCIRTNHADAQVLEQLNKRYIPNFEPAPKEQYIRLVTHNWQAQQINEGELAKIKEKTYTYKAEITGTFPEYSFPTEGQLSLKLGAQVMFIKNDTEKRYYNGTLGEIIAIDEKCITVRTADHRFEIKLEQEEWQNTRYALNEETQQIEEKVEGSFRQFPIKLAWAITIHKSQGLTFERAIIDAHSAFAHGQTYVALSRCKTLEGLVLSSPIPPSAIIQDSAVCHFNEQAEQLAPTANAIDILKHQHCLKLISSLFDFSSIRHALNTMIRLLGESFSKLYPETIKKYNVIQPSFNNEILAVAEKFQSQYQRLVFASPSSEISPELQDRLKKGTCYFHEKLLPIYQLAQSTVLPSDNKEIQKRATNVIDLLREELLNKCYLLAYVNKSGFNIVDFQKCRAQLAAGQLVTPDGTAADKQEQTSTSRSSQKQEKLVIPTEIQHQELYSILYKWRRQKAAEENVPAFQVLQNKAILGISNILPMDKRTLSMIPYFGAKGLEFYGEEILELIHKYVKANEMQVKEPSFYETKSQPRRKQNNEIKNKSAEITLDMFKSHKTVEEIAKERNLAVSTIYRHLQECITDGTLPLEEFVAPERIKRIKAELDKISNPTEIKISEIRSALHEEFNYPEIAAVLATYYKKDK